MAETRLKIAILTPSNGPGPGEIDAPLTLSVVAVRLATGRRGKTEEEDSS